MYHFGPYQQTFLTVVFVICVAYVIIGTVKLMLKKPVALGLHIALFIGSLCLPVGFFILATASSFLSQRIHCHCLLFVLFLGGKERESGDSTRGGSQDRGMLVPVRDTFQVLFALQGDACRGGGRDK